ncbi:MULTISPECIES: hypothetical protein [unclassified Beijerinckia]|uniref:hypothetical protein n=1 Tax=unclassified Beijerinckia TaxID=2638183 RepID=UPI0008973107|nr:MULTISPECIES: hypothetical protein [unclassified Beijerinckia]MDH7795636.1 hypothetical protein [Beijerinckia sp. GAS462]SEC09712.1 hypothetical protein SAMN05443249_1913 [Beijerinckia sp. 28-YEA-48]
MIRPNLRPVVLSFAIVLAAPLSAFALESFVLENVRLETPTNKTSILLKRVEFVDTNLTREEAQKLFSLDADRGEQTAIVTKAQAKRIFAPEIVVEPKGERTGLITLRTYEVNDLDRGRFAKVSLASIDGSATDKAGAGTIKSGPIVLEQGDFGRIITAVKDGDFTNGVAQLGKFSWTGFELVVPDTKVPGAQMKFGMASMVGGNTYDDGLPVTMKAEIKNATFEPAKGSEMAQSFAQFGYDKIDMGMTVAGAYDLAKKAFTLSDYTLSGVNAGQLTLTGLFGNIDRTALVGDRMARLSGLMQGNVSEFTVRFANQGLFDKALSYYATTVNRAPADIKAEWASAATGMLPMLLGGDPSALKLAEAVNVFLRDPKSLTVTLKGKNGPVSFMEATQIKDPATFMQKVGVTATANQ